MTMRIWHAGSAASPLQLGGVNATIWLLAGEQARLGQQVSLLLEEPPDAAARRVAGQVGIELIHVPCGRWSFNRRQLAEAIDAGRPDVVHMHSVFIPRQISLASALTRRRIPYVVTPHGGLSRQVLHRGRLKKCLYSYFMEIPRFARAAAIINSPGEEPEVVTFLGSRHPPMHTISVPVEGAAVGGVRWSGNLDLRRFVFLGRFDVFIKGIDLLVEVARRMPASSFHLYGTEDPKTRQWLRRLQRQGPPNVWFHGPVYGAEKMQIVADASMYLQLSRSESFGISIAEAMSLGVPCAVTETIKMGTVFRQHRLGLTLPFDADLAASRLNAALERPDELREVARQAQRYAQSHFSPDLAAQRHLSLYAQVSAGERPGKSAHPLDELFWAPPGVATSPRWAQRMYLRADVASSKSPPGLANRSR